MDLLETWLTEKAKLSGPRLTLAINACNEGAVYSVQDLLQLHEMGNLGLVFSQGMICSLLQSALERDKDNINARDPTPKVQTVLGSSAAIPQGQTQSQGNTIGNTEPTKLDPLPPHKSFGAFISHKKVTSQQPSDIHFGQLTHIFLFLFVDALQVW